MTSPPDPSSPPDPCSPPDPIAREAHVLRVACARGLLSPREAEALRQATPVGQRLARLAERLPPAQLSLLRQAYADYGSPAPRDLASPPLADPAATFPAGAAGAVVQSAASPARPGDEGAPRSRLPRPGEAVDDYRVERLLGRGGMGAVFAARDPAGREVALKIHLGRRHERFQLEGEAVARLDHPGIVRVHTQGIDQEGRLYCVMSLVAGGSLDDYLVERRPLPVREAVEVTLQAAAALGYAHAKGVLHRDVKPGNLLRTPAGQIVVTDFGLARVVDQSQHLSMTGDLLGTPAYMSPEQARGEVRAIGPGADVYGLGATLYDLLCDRPPFADMPPIQLLLSVANLEPEPPSLHRPGVEPAVDAIVLRCLAKDPAERYPSMDALAADLAGYLEEGASGVRALADSRARQRRGVLAAALGGLLVAALPFALLAGGAPRDPSSPPPLDAPRDAPQGALRLRDERELQLEPGQAARFEVAPLDSAVRLELSGAEGTPVEVAGGGDTRALVCEASWALPLTLVRDEVYRPLRSGTYTVRLPAAAPGPVRLRLQRWRGVAPPPAARSEPWEPYPPVEVCFREGPARDRAAELMAGFRENFDAIRRMKAMPQVSRIYQDMRQLKTREGLPPAELLLATIGRYALLYEGISSKEASQLAATKLLPDYPDLFAVQWHAHTLYPKEPALALRHLERCRELEPARASVRRDLLQRYAKSGDEARLEREARQLLALKPDDSFATLWIATLNAERGRGGEGEGRAFAKSCLGLTPARVSRALARFAEALRPGAAPARADHPERVRAMARGLRAGLAGLARSPVWKQRRGQAWLRLLSGRVVFALEGPEAARAQLEQGRGFRELAQAWDALSADVEAAAEASGPPRRPASPR